MQDELRQLKDRLRRNELIWAGFREIELALIGARNLRDIVTILANGLPRQFAGVDRATLACIDPEYELARLIEGGTGAGAGESPLPGAPAAVTTGFVSLMSSQQCATLFPPSFQPYLGPIRAEDGALFPGGAGRLASVALVPLLRHGELVGSLNQGSADSRHFSADAATDLLKHLGAVTALCIDNSIGHERLKLDGLTDPLTGVANRRLFDRRLAEEVERSRRAGKPLSCVLVDVDHFKRLNDTHGHQAGDRALREVAHTLGADLRTADVLARFGGEEFVLLLPDTPAGQAAAIAERLRRRIAALRFDREGSEGFALTVSAGVATAFGEDRLLPGADRRLLSRADVALYEAKRQGRNRVVSAPPVSPD